MSDVDDNCNKDFNSWKLKSDNSLSNYVQSNHDKNKFKQKNRSNNKSKSTLSLHIEAYENAVEADGDTVSIRQEPNMKDKIKAKTAFICSTSIIQNPLEFPRQQESSSSKSTDAETVPLKASQTLLNPNDSNEQQIRENYIQANNFWYTSNQSPYGIMVEIPHTQDPLNAGQQNILSRAEGPAPSRSEHSEVVPAQHGFGIYPPSHPSWGRGYAPPPGQARYPPPPAYGTKMKRKFNETGIRWFQRLNPKSVNHSTGIKQLDNFMKNGFGPGCVVEIDGAGGSGKTEFCFTMMAENFNKHDYNNYIYYFDYTGAFNPLRFKEILLNRFGPKTEEQVNELLKRVVSIIIRDEKLFCEALQRFKEVTKNRKVSLLIIENIGLILGGTVRSLSYFKATGRYYQHKVYEAINHISLDLGIPVVVTNHLRGWKIAMKPALGKYWESLIYHHILIIRQNREFLIQNFDVKRGPTSAAMKFYLTEKGITEC